jgi:glycosyltransferase involved in cell wall biosynthesis
MNPSITVAIPTIPPRRKLLVRALESVFNQSLPPVAISIATDVHKEGAARTRQRALDAVKTEWVAFLDDDDELLPYHLEHLMVHAQKTSADYVYAWYYIVMGDAHYVTDLVFPPGHYSNPWDPDNPRQTTVTTLVKTELAKKVGFDWPESDKEIHGQRRGEDYEFTLGCNRLGTISHLVERTWLWHHDSNNTSGRSDKW